MPQFDFLRQFIEQMLDELGLGDLNEKEKNQYLPQLTRQLQERIGIVLLPKLSDSDLERFSRLTDKTASRDEWQLFWTTALPNFAEEMKAILTDFTTEVKAITSSV